ncbi:MAG: hypothetical protein U0V87_03855 [Acidobacteriota bacterium]
MATIDTTHVAHAPSAHVAGDNYLTHSRGVLSWMFTLDHKRIGVMYLIGVLWQPS